MASPSDGVPPSDEASGAKTPSSRLETLPREDLIAFVKKQMILLKRTKTKNEELTKQLSNRPSSDQNKGDVFEKLKSEVVNLTTERDDIIAAYNASQQSQEEAAARIITLEMAIQNKVANIKSLVEENECMKMKQETMMSSFQCVQEEVTNIKQQNKDLVDQLNVVTKARDEALAAFKNFKQSAPSDDEKVKYDQLQSERDTLSQQMSKLEDVHSRCTAQLSSLNEKLLEMQNTSQQEHEDHQKSTLKLAKAMKLIEKLKLDRTQRLQETTSASDSVNQELLSLKEQFTMLQNQEDIWKKEKTDFESKIDTLNIEIVELKDNIASYEKQVYAQQSQNQTTTTENKTLSDQLSSLEMKYHNVESDMEKMTEETEKMKSTLAEEKAEKEKANLLLTEAQSVNASAREEMAAMAEKLTAAEKEFVNCRQQVVNKETQMVEYEKESSVKVRTLVEQLEQSRCELTNYKHEVEEYAKATEMLNTKLEHLEIAKTEAVSVREQAASVMATTQTQNMSETESLNEKVSSFEHLNKDLENQLADAKEELWVIVKEKEELIERAASAEAKMNEWESMMQMLQEERDKMEGELNQVKDVELNNANELDDLSASLHEALQERDTLKDQVYSFTEENVCGAETVGRLKQMIDESRFERDEINQRNQTLVDDYATLKDQIDSMRKDAELLNSENETLSNESTIWKLNKEAYTSKINELEHEIEALNDQLKNVAGAEDVTAKELASLRSEVGALKKEKEAFDGEKEKLIIEVQELTRQVEISDGELQKVTKQMEDARQQLESIVPEREMVEAKLMELSNVRRAADNIQDENEKLKEKVADLQSGNEELGKLQQHIDVLEQTLQEQLQTINAQCDSITTMEEIITPLNSSISEKEEMLVNKSSEIDTLSTDCQRLQDELFNLQGCIKESEANKKDLEKVIEEKTSTEQQLTLQVSQLSAKVDAHLALKETRESDENTTIKDLEERLSELASSNSELVRKLDTQLAEKQDTVEANKTYELEVETLRKAVVDSKNDLEQTQLEMVNVCKQHSAHIDELGENKTKLEQRARDLEEIKTGIVADMKGLTLKYQTLVDESTVYKNSVIQELEALKCAKECAMAEAGDLRYALAGEEDGKDASTLELISLKQELIVSNSENNTLKEKVDKINYQLQKTVDERSDFENKLTNSISKINETEAFVLNCKEQINTLVSQSEAMRSDFETKLNDALAQAESYQTELSASNKNYEELSELIADLETQLAHKESVFSQDLNNEKSLVSEKDSIIDKITHELERLTISKSVCEKENSELLGESSDLRGAVDNLTEKVNVLEEGVKQRENKVMRLQEEIRELENSQRNMQTQLVDMEQNKATFSSKHETETENLNKQIEEKERDVLNMEQENQHYKEELERSQIEIKELKAIVNEKLQNTEAEVVQDPESSQRIENLEKQLKEREIRENKFKQLALKAKKEGAEWKNKFDTLGKDYENSKLTVQKLESQMTDQQERFQQTSHNTAQNAQNFQSLQNEYDHLEGNLEEERSLRKKLEEDFRQAVEELASSKLKLAQHIEEYDQLNAQIKSLHTTLGESKEQSLALGKERHAERIVKEKAYSDKHEMEEKVSSLEADMASMKEDHQKTIFALHEQLKETASRLDQAIKGAHQSNMMDLEIADYERTVQSLHDSVSEREGRILDLQSEVTRLDEKVKSLQTQRDQAESQHIQSDDRGNKLKALLVKVKKDLAEAKKLENEQKTNEAQMQGQLENLTQECEEYKIQISGLVGENQKLSDKIRGLTENQQRVNRSLEVKVQSLEHDLELARSELSASQTEYEGYKVRVHSVLKQQKTKGADEFAVEQEKQEKHRMQNVIDQLRSKLHESGMQVDAMKNENEALQEDIERMHVRHNKTLRDIEDKDTSWRHRYDKLGAEQSMHNTEHVETIKQLTMQNEMLTLTFKEQTRVMQEEHQRSVDTLNKQVDMADRENCQLQNRLQSTPSSATLVSSGSAPNFEDARASPVEMLRDLRHEERQSGEGMENTELEHCSHAQTGVLSPTVGPTILPFEQLLNSPTDDTASVKTLESASFLNEDVLRKSLHTAEKRIEHLSEVLNESEANSMRLSEQAKILKGEIRRLERNQARENAISNMEYLKNVVFKFLTLRGGDERTRLIPVLTTMLKLSPDEKQLLAEIADADAAAMAQGGDASGWGAYLHRWTGLT